RTQLKNPNVKVNWQATKKDNISFLYLDGFKIKDGRSPGVTGITFDAPTATYHQDNAYEDNPLHGLCKSTHAHAFGPTLFVWCQVSPANTTRGSSSIRSEAWTRRPVGTSSRRRRTARSTRASTSGRSMSAISTLIRSSKASASRTT